MSITIEYIASIITPIITAVGGWFIGSKKRNNDFLSELQSSINLLSAENNKLLQELVTVRKENASLLYNQEMMSSEIKALRQENASLRMEIEELTATINNYGLTWKKKKRS